MSKQFYVYILASKKNGTLYVGITSNLIGRISVHKQNITKSFTSKYLVHNLVYFENHANSLEAISREKQLKNWKREWKIQLIEKNNPDWKDLYNEIIL